MSKTRRHRSSKRAERGGPGVPHRDFGSNQVQQRKVSSRSLPGYKTGPSSGTSPAPRQAPRSSGYSSFPGPGTGSPQLVVQQPSTPAPPSSQKQEPSHYQSFPVAPPPVSDQPQQRRQAPPLTREEIAKGYRRRPSR